MLCSSSVFMASSTVTNILLLPLLLLAEVVEIVVVIVPPHSPPCQFSFVLTDYIMYRSVIIISCCPICCTINSVVTWTINVKIPIEVVYIAGLMFCVYSLSFLIFNILFVLKKWRFPCPRHAGKWREQIYSSTNSLLRH